MQTSHDFQEERTIRSREQFSKEIIFLQASWSVAAAASRCKNNAAPGHTRHENFKELVCQFDSSRSGPHRRDESHAHQPFFHASRAILCFTLNSRHCEFSTKNTASRSPDSGNSREKKKKKKRHTTKNTFAKNGSQEEGLGSIVSLSLYFFFFFLRLMVATLIGGIGRKLAVAQMKMATVTHDWRKLHEKIISDSVIPRRIVFCFFFFFFSFRRDWKFHSWHLIKFDVDVNFRQECAQE